MGNEKQFWAELTGKLRNLREKNGYTQPDVASRIGIGLSAYKSYELGDRRVPVDVLTKLSKLYNVSMDEILGNPIQAKEHVIYGDFTEEQFEKIKKYAELVRKNEL